MSINLGILAHVDAGKTTLTEALLYHSGVIRRMGRVDSGTTITDGMALERQRGMTIRASTVSFEWRGKRINLIDTPGHMDFIAEVERSFAVLDGVILVISGKEGVQPQTRVLFRKLSQRRVPTILFINKLDRVGANLDALKRDIARMLTTDAVYLQDADGVGGRDFSITPRSFGSQPLRDEAIACSDALLERYLADQPISDEDCRAALILAARECRRYPALMGAALHDVGVAEVLPAITTYFQGVGDPLEPLSALVYKVEWTERAHKRVYLRLFAGGMRFRETLADGLTVKALFTPSQGAFIPVGQVEAGDIAVLTDVPGLKCGDWIGGRFRDDPFEKAAPLPRSVVEPDSAARRSELISALKILEEEDPFLELDLDAETEEISVRMFGALQIEIIQALLLERFGLTARFAPPRVIYKERLLRLVESGIHMGEPGNHHYAGITLALEPLPPGSGVEYESRVSLGDLTVSFQNGVREGVMAGLAKGLNDGVTDVRVLFVGMEFDSVMGTPADYRRLAPKVVRLALETAGVRRLTPWQSFDLTVPLAHQKAVLRMLTESRAVIDEVINGESEMRALGMAPLDSFQPFTRAFQSATAGQGVLDTAFAKYLDS